MVNVALDAMGGDNAPEAIVQGAVDAIKENSNIKVYLVGKEINNAREQIITELK